MVRKVILSLWPLLQSTNHSTGLTTSQCVSIDTIIICAMCGKTVYVFHFPIFILDDDNRIVLQPIDGHPDCQHDYINASYIDVRTRTYM